MHGAGEGAGPEESLVYCLVRTPPSPCNRAVRSTEGVRGALLLLLHQPRVPVRSVGGAEEVAAAAAEPPSYPPQRILRPVHGAVLSEPASVGRRRADEEVVAFEEEHASSVRLDPAERVVLEHDIAHVGVQHQPVLLQSLFQEAAVEVEAVHADRPVRLVQRLEVILHQRRPVSSRQPRGVLLRPPTEQNYLGGAAGAPQGGEEDAQLLLSDVILRPKNEILLLASTRRDWHPECQ
mmetsp:Transcript_60749/g.143327  ORF Transcript_60749/g.143327 Transcript_60749/m.143327 type:complete len:236 (+) Transcript_60749:2076-2783(+)